MSPILRLAIPSILAGISIPLVGIVDVAIIGHIADTSAVAGIALGTMLFDLLYWNFGFLRTGTSGLTAQALGRGDQSECSRLLGQGLLTALAVALCIWLLQWCFVSLVLWCVPGSEEASAFARQYFAVRIWAAPATLMLMAIKGWLIGMQNTRASMVVDLTVNLGNIAASWLLTIGMGNYHGIGAIGVAWGTLAAQYIGLLTAVAILFIQYPTHLTTSNIRTTSVSPLSPITYNLSPIKALLPTRAFFRLNANLFVRSTCMLVIYIGYTVVAAGYGDTELAVSNLLMKLFLFFSYFADGFAYAGEALVGKEGATADGWQLTPAVRQTIRSLMMWAIAIGIGGSLVYATCATPLLRVMTDSAELLAAARPYYIWLALMPIASSLAFVWDGIYIGKADGRALRNSLLWAVLAFLLPLVLLSLSAHLLSADTPLSAQHPSALYPLSPITYLLSPQTLYLSYFLHLVVRSLYFTLLYRKTVK